MDKKNLRIRFTSFLACLFMLLIWAICIISISSKSFFYKFHEVINVLAVLSFILLIILTFSAFINWKSKKAPWYEFVIYASILLMLVFIAIIQIGTQWKKGTGVYYYRTHNANYADSAIVGKWVNTTDTSLKLIFPNKNFCETYRSNNLIRTDSVIISNKVSICNAEPSIKNLEDYKLYIRFKPKTGKLDTLFHSCYAILSINDSNFDFTTSDGSIISYQKQQ